MRSCGAGYVGSKPTGWDGDALSWLMRSCGAGYVGSKPTVWDGDS